MTRMYYAIDRSPDVVSGRGHPAIVAWCGNKSARDNFVATSQSIQSATKKEAEVLCREWYGISLVDALRKGLI